MSTRTPLSTILQLYNGGQLIISWGTGVICESYVPDTLYYIKAYKNTLPRAQIDPQNLPCLHTDYILDKWKLINAFYMYSRWKFAYQEGRVGIPLTNLIPMNVSACSWISCVIYRVRKVQLRWEVIVRFVDIDGVDDHQGLKLSFIYLRTRSCSLSRNELSNG